MSVLEALKARISDQYGLEPRPEWDDVLSAGLGSNPEALNESPALRDLASRITIEESHFMRHPEQLEFAADWLSRRLETKPLDPVRVWSAGCCRGEEPYSLIMLLIDRIPDLFPGRLDVLGTDLSHGAIRVARRGLYNEWSMRGVSTAIRERYFEISDTFLALRPGVKRFARFENLSIQEQVALFTPGEIDLILFRNVSVYMASRSADQVYESMARVIDPDGLLVVSATDPRPSKMLFGLVDHSQCNILKPVRGAKPQPAPFASVPEGGAGRRVRTFPPPSPPLPPVPPPSLEALVREAVALGDRGRLDAAIDTADRAVAAHPRSKIGYALRGRLRVAAHEQRAAAADFERVLSLDPGDHLARYWYAETLRGGGYVPRSVEMLKDLAERLRLLPDEKVIEGEALDGEAAITVGELKAAVRFMREAME